MKRAEAVTTPQAGKDNVVGYVIELKGLKELNFTRRTVLQDSRLDRGRCSVRGRGGGGGGGEVLCALTNELTVDPVGTEILI
jgi:hypothetical protein